MPEMTTQTVTYKTIAGCDIRADVYTRPHREPQPAIISLHGGALILGHRGMIHPGHLAGYLDAGYAVVAIDYRLAPETKLPQILADVHDAIAWVRAEGPGRFSIDPTRLALVGHSAGGYLTFQVGATVQPRPQALVSFYGYADIVGPWYTTPSPFSCQQPLVSEAEARAAVGTAPLSAAPSGTARGRFYLYCRQRGIWPQEVTGLDPNSALDALLAYCPIQHVPADHPPSLLLHGDADTDVPYEQSLLMAAALERAGVAHRLLTIPGGEHGFDWRVNDPTVDAAFAEVLAFLSRYLQPRGDHERQ